jgi:hypothetical protein
MIYAPTLAGKPDGALWLGDSTLSGTCTFRCEDPLRRGYRRSFRNLMTTCELPRRIAAQAFQRVRTPPPCSKSEGVFLLDSQCGCRTKMKVNVLLRVKL